MQRAVVGWLYLLFFLSGFPALIYQIVWQRALFAIYGVNIESVTVVVSAFMLGLGLGSLIGGRIAKNRAAPLLLLFGGAELGTALYGIASLPLFHWVARFTAGSPAFETAILSFALVMIPTVLMGATLPLLVAQLVNLSGNVGRSVGVLYFANTLGSAVACFLAGLVIMRRLGMSGSVELGATLNTLVGAVVLVMHFRWRGRRSTEQVERDEGEEAAPILFFPMAVVLAAMAGFLSLSYEIVWFRLYSYASGGPAQCFAFVLGAVLTGVAFGSVLSRRICRQEPAEVTRLVRSILVLVVLANLLGFSIVPLTALLVQHMNYLWSLPLVALAAGMLGATFPLVCHISVRPDARAGTGMSYLYLSNIIGAAAGSCVVGFVLMDVWPLRWISVFLALLGVGIAVALLGAAKLDLREKIKAYVLSAGLSAAVLFSSQPLFATVYGQMQSKQDWGQPGTGLTDVVENRSGVITVDEDGAIFGGGVFDGWMTTDIRETDQLMRPLALSFFHPSPKEVLEVGMSGGAWSEIIANHPQLEKQVIVEINPGYIEVVRRYPPMAPLLRNPKVDLVIDDGRRWMFRHRDRKFDVIVMDTIYNWRAHATNLLSAEFLSLARQLLKPGGILYYNTTFSPEAQRTGAEQFPYAFRFGPLMVVSDSPIQIDRERWRSVLLSYRLEGKPILDPAVSEDRERLEEILRRADTLPGNTYVSEGMETRANILRRTRGMRVVTDDNMATEWSQ
jgi:predicted membrane-bound spermidine synthase